MPFGRRRPGEKNGEPTWTYVKTPPGFKQYGFKAGEPEWVITHFCPVSKPCLEVFTNGDLDCEIDHRKFRLEETGYFPWFDDAGRPCVSIIREHEADAALKTPHLAPLWLLRGTGEKDNLRLNYKPTRERFATTSKHKLRPADIRNWLILFWQMENLTAWYGSNRQVPGQLPAGDVDTIPGLRAPGEPGDMSATLDKLSARNAAVNLADESFREVQERLLRKSKQFSKNGSGEGGAK